jgi:hypothetical protein
VLDGDVVLLDFGRESGTECREEGLRSGIHSEHWRWHGTSKGSDVEDETAFSTTTREEHVN